MMLKAARYVNSFDKALIVHAIEEHMNHSGYMHEGAVSARLGVPGIPSIAEDMAVARDAIIASIQEPMSTSLILQVKGRWISFAKQRKEVCPLRAK